MLNWRLKTAALSLLLSLFGAKAAHSQSLEEMEAIAASAPDLPRFLSDPELVEKYYTALWMYYDREKFVPGTPGGTEFRKSFEAILRQLRGAIAKEPAIAARLWETTNLGPTFEFQTMLKTRGRLLGVEEWNDYLEKWKRDLKKESEEYGRGPSPENRERVTKYFETLSAEIEAKEAEWKTLPKKAAADQQSVYYRELAVRPDFVAASSHLLHQKLETERVQDLFLSNDPDIVLDTIVSLRASGPGEFADWATLSPRMARLVAGRIPTETRFLENEKIFPRETRTTRRGRVVEVGGAGLKTYTFRSILRRFHGIWKGIPISECVGGGNQQIRGNHALDHLSPERWLTVALKDSFLQSVECDGSYYGFVEGIPVRKGGKTYVSLGFGAPQLSRDAIVADPANPGATRRVKLYLLWLDRMTRLKKPGWSGFIVSESEAINNAGVLTTVWESTAYKYSMNIGHASEKQVKPAQRIGSLRGHEEKFDGTPAVENADADMAARIVAISEEARKSALASYYGGNMIFDAMAPDAGKLMRLRVIDERKLGKYLRDPVRLEKLLLMRDVDFRHSFFTSINKELNRFTAAEIQRTGEALSARGFIAWMDVVARYYQPRPHGDWGGTLDEMKAFSSERARRLNVYYQVSHQSLEVGLAVDDPQLTYRQEHLLQNADILRGEVRRMFRDGPLTRLDQVAEKMLGMSEFADAADHLLLRQSLKTLVETRQRNLLLAVLYRSGDRDPAVVEGFFSALKTGMNSVANTIRVSDVAADRVLQKAIVDHLVTIVEHHYTYRARLEWLILNAGKLEPETLVVFERDYAQYVIDHFTAKDIKTYRFRTAGAIDPAIEAMASVAWCPSCQSNIKTYQQALKVLDQSDFSDAQKERLVEILKVRKNDSSADLKIVEWLGIRHPGVVEEMITKGGFLGLQQLVRAGVRDPRIIDEVLKDLSSSKKDEVILGLRLIAEAAPERKDLQRLVLRLARESSDSSIRLWAVRAYVQYANETEGEQRILVEWMSDGKDLIQSAAAERLQELAATGKLLSGTVEAVRKLAAKSVVTGQSPPSGRPARPSPAQRILEALASAGVCNGEFQQQ